MLVFKWSKKGYNQWIFELLCKLEFYRLIIFIAPNFCLTSLVKLWLYHFYFFFFSWSLKNCWIINLILRILFFYLFFVSTKKRLYPSKEPYIFWLCPFLRRYPFGIRDTNCFKFFYKIHKSSLWRIPSFYDFFIIL